MDALGCDSGDPRAETITLLSKDSNNSSSVNSTGTNGLRGRTAVVISDFNGLGADQLTLFKGERILIHCKEPIVLQNTVWWTGTSGSGKTGTFPATCVQEDSIGLTTEELSYPLEINFQEMNFEGKLVEGCFNKAVYTGTEVAVWMAKQDTVKSITKLLFQTGPLLHKNVCKIIGVNLKHNPYIVMEYARGGSLSSVIHNSSISLSVANILDWGKQIAEGMQYIHDKVHPPVVHGDLKSSNTCSTTCGTTWQCSKCTPIRHIPNNILQLPLTAVLLFDAVEPNTEARNTIKIANFGLAENKCTDIVAVCHNPWIAPELVSSSKFTKEGDVWSYGVLIWEMLTRLGPCSSCATDQSLGKCTPVPIPTNFPDDLQKLITDCWMLDQSLRPSFTVIKLLVTAIQMSELSATSAKDFAKLQHSWKQETNQDTQSKASQDTQSKASQDTQIKTSQDTQIKTSQDTQSKTSQDTQSKTSQDTQSKTSQDTQSKTSQDTQSKTSQDAAVQDTPVQLDKDNTTTDNNNGTQQQPATWSQKKPTRVRKTSRQQRRLTGRVTELPGELENFSMANMLSSGGVEEGETPDGVLSSEYNPRQNNVSGVGELVLLTANTN